MRERDVAPDFWTLVFRQFAKRRRAVLAWWVVLALFACAIFAPFLASSRPLYLEQGGRATFPAMAALTAGDFAWLAGFAAAVTGRIVYGILRRREPNRSHISRSLAVAAAVFVVGASLALLRPHRADRVDWAASRASAEREGGRVVLAPIPFNPIEASLTRRLKHPAQDGHFLGTDSAGRDVAARMVWGARVSLIVGFVAVAIFVSIGTVVGSLAGFFGGRIDLAAQRLIEVMMCFPTFFLILAILAFVGQSIFNIMIVIGLTGWTGVARLVRGEMLRLRNLDFVTAGVALGASSPRLIFRHLLPNALSPVLVSATFGIAGAILVEAALSFLGLGVAPPTPSWGQLLQDGRAYALSHPWLALYPGLAIFITVTAYNLVGEGLRDALDPRLKK